MIGQLLCWQRHGWISDFVEKTEPGKLSKYTKEHLKKKKRMLLEIFAKMLVLCSTHLCEQILHFQPQIS